MNTGDYLSIKRAEKGLSVSGLAEKLNISEEEVRKWGDGELPDSEHLLALSALLGVSVEDILRGGDAHRDEESEQQEPGPVNSSHSEDLQTAQAEFDEPAISEDIAYSGNEFVSSQSGNYIRSDGAIGASGRNGYSSAERKFGYIVFAAFIAIIIFISFMRFFNWATRPRELTVDNYKNYIEIEITPARSFNPDEYIVSVTPNTRIADFRMTLEVDFRIFDYSSGTGFIEFSETVTISGNPEEQETIEQSVRIGEIAFEEGYKVISVSGGLE